ERLRLKLLPVAFAVREFVRDHMGLEYSRIPEDGDITRKEVTRSEGEGEDYLRHREVANLGARLDPLTGDIRDVSREVLVDEARQLAPWQPFGGVGVIGLGGQRSDLVMSRGLGHLLQVVHIRAELGEE